MLFQLVVDSKSFPTKMHKRRIDLFVRFFIVYSKSYHFPHKMHRSRRVIEGDDAVFEESAEVLFLVNVTLS